jgi:hypothetical protein
MKGMKLKIMDWKPPETFAEGVKAREESRQNAEACRERSRKVNERGYERIMNLAGQGRKAGGK